MNFITINDGIITGIFNGDIDADLSNTHYFGHEKIAVPCLPLAGDPISFYDENWQRKSDKKIKCSG